MSYSSNFPNSFLTDKTLVSTPAIDSTGLFAKASTLKFNTVSFDPGVELGPSDNTWTFICAPEGISWTTSNAVNRVDIFGTNNPPAVSGTRGMRELTLSNALVEGFTRNKTVEAKVLALEDLLAYKSSLSGGYVNVPVYQVWANQKGYGKQAYYLLKSVQVKETMRDLTGDATRAFVDVSFLEVPAYQVDSGLDQAPFSNTGINSYLLQTGFLNAQAQVKFATAAQQQVGTPAKPASGANSASPAAPSTSNGGAAGASSSTIKGRSSITRLGGN